jgi:ferritin-like metal-binding protein YciE
MMAVQSSETVRDFMIEGLRNDHAMESQAITLTTGQADRLKHYADLEQRLRQHITETEGQRDRLERCLEKLGTSASTLKDAALKTAANMQMMLHAMASDEVVKNVLASFAFENFEIASYKALVETAKLAGEPEIVSLCEENLREEEAMADWLDHHLPDVVHKYLSRASADVEAKV